MKYDIQISLFLLFLALLLFFWPVSYEKFPVPGQGIFISPFGKEPYVITSAYQGRMDPFTGEASDHSGWDVAALSGEGTTLYAICDGKVTFADSNAGGYGNLIIITPKNNTKMSIYYGHLRSFSVYSGQEVKAGQPIGREGATGKATGPHLHFEVRIDDVPVDGSAYWDLLSEAANKEDFEESSEDRFV